MDTQAIPLKTTGIRFVRAVRTFAQSEVGWKAKLIFTALVLLLCASNALNVINSYVGRNFMTAIADRDMSRLGVQDFVKETILVPYGYSANIAFAGVFYHAVHGCAQSWMLEIDSPLTIGSDVIVEVPTAMRVR